MTNLVPQSGGLANFGERREDKALNRGLNGLERRTTMSLARIASDAKLAAARVHAIGYVGQEGLQTVAMLSQLEGLLGQAVPLAVTRLQGIADITALAIAEEVHASAREIGR